MFYKGSICYKFLWVRIALLNKCLTKIVDHIVANADRFYACYALVADPVDGPIFSSLLVGPCALEYTRMKTCDHLWTDPNADELLQRHRMHSSYNPNSSNFYYNFNHNLHGTSQVVSSVQANGSVTGVVNSPKIKPGLNASIMAKRKASMNALEDISNQSGQLGTIHSKCPTPQTPDFSKRREVSTPFPSSPSSPMNTATNSAKEYVESLHQNSKSQLLYGKNNVVVHLVIFLHFLILFKL